MRAFGRVVGCRSKSHFPVEWLEARVMFSTYLVTNLNDSGPGSLRDAISQAQATTGNVVAFDPSDFGAGALHTISIRAGLTVAKPVTINGPGSDVVALAKVTATDPIFGVIPSGTLWLHGVSLTGAMGPAVFNQGTVTADDCRFANNSAVQGGGIYNQGVLTVTRCTFSGNTASPGSGGGAAIANFSHAAISGSTFLNNSGKAVYNGGTMTVTNSTFTGNSASGSFSGGAIWDGPFNSNPAHLTVTNCTISGNSGMNGGGIAGGGMITLNNTIVAGNIVPGTTMPSDISANVTGSNNLVGTGESGGLVNGMNGNIVGVDDPKLGPLANNGGPTMTMALLPGSPAIDAGSNALAVGGDGKPLLTDQRGYARIISGTVDIGAYEAGSSQYILPGDANGDGKVDFSDLLILAQEYGHFNERNLADFNGDGKVDFADLLILAQNYGQSIAASPAANDVFAATATTDLLHRPKVRRP